MAADPVANVVGEVAGQLAAAGVPSPDVDARWLVAAATVAVAPTGDLAARPHTTREGRGAPSSPRSTSGPAGHVDRARLAGMVAQRVARVPLQVIVGSTAFRHVTLLARSGVFVPRPETEVVAGAAIAAALAVAPGPARVVDACTGSGAIALAVASEVPGVQVVATEVDADARSLAVENLAALRSRSPVEHDTTILSDRAHADPSPVRLAASRDQPRSPDGAVHRGPRWHPGDRLAPGASVEFVAGDLLDGVDVSWRGTVDVLVANPPYLPAVDRGSWEPEVADHDPDGALVGGDDGHEVVDRLLGLAPGWLRPGGTVVVEVDARRGADAVAAATLAGLQDAQLVVDLAGRDRAVVARAR